jgi:signal recognition particle subunit SRP72
MSPSGQSLATLLKKTHISSPEDILKSANVAIKQNKTDVMALHVRIVALLKLERYEDVLRAYEDAGDKFKQHAPLEYAYALYRCDKLEEAQKIVEKSGSQDRGLLHVAAQSV